MKQIEKGTISALHDNMLTENNPITSITVRINRDIQNIGGYSGNRAIIF